VVASAPRRAAGCLLGLLLAIPVHIAGLSIGMLLMVAFRLAPMEPWPERTANLFVISFGLWQWIYLVPLLRYVRTRRPSLAAGLALSGVLGWIFAALALLTLVHGM
jgi:hypothetical protein